MNSIKIKFLIHFCLLKSVDFHLCNIDPTVCNKFNKFKIEKRQTLENYIDLMNTTKKSFYIHFCLLKSVNFNLSNINHKVGKKFKQLNTKKKTEERK